MAREEAKDAYGLLLVELEGVSLVLDNPTNVHGQEDLLLGHLDERKTSSQRDLILTAEVVGHRKPLALAVFDDLNLVVVRSARHDLLDHVNRLLPSLVVKAAVVNADADLAETLQVGLHHGLVPVSLDRLLKLTDENLRVWHVKHLDAGILQHTLLKEGAVRNIHVDRQTRLVVGAGGDPHGRENTLESLDRATKRHPGLTTSEEALLDLGEAAGGSLTHEVVQEDDGPVGIGQYD